MLKARHETENSADAPTKEARGKPEIFGAPAGIWTRVRGYLPVFWRREAAIHGPFMKFDRTILPEH